MTGNSAGENVHVRRCWCCNEYPKACDTTTYGFVYYCDNRNCCECEDVEPMTLDRWNKRSATLNKRTAAIPPLPWLRAEEVTEPGHYWYFWQKDGRRSKPAAMYVSQGDEGTIVVHARGGITPVDMGGLWQRIPEPELPKEESK